VELYQEHAAKAKAQLQLCTTVHHNVAVLDLRHEETIFAVNRFMVYALFPNTNISIHVMWGVQKQNTVCAVGKSITNRSSRVNIGALMLVYGGGGHENAGTCQIANERADTVLQELVGRINAVG
jgi:nanoRNase/pAp phosphatase (c-di-AMP/oligoRNAs hydrolase)